MAPPMMMPTSDSSRAKAPIPLISCWIGPAPGMASKSGLNVTFCARMLMRNSIGGPLRWSCRESIGHGGGYLQVRASGNGAQTVDLGLGAGGEVRVPWDLDHGPAAPLEVLLDLVQFDQALLPDRVDDRDGVADQLGVAVLVQPVQRRGGRPGRVEAWRHDDDDLVGQLEDSLCGRFQDTGSGVEQDQVVVALQQGDGPAVLLLAQGGGDA